MTAAILIIVLATVVLSVLTYAAGHNVGWYDGWDKGWDECDQITAEYIAGLEEIVALQKDLIERQDETLKGLESGNECTGNTE